MWGGVGCGVCETGWGMRWGDSEVQGQWGWMGPVVMRCGLGQGGCDVGVGVRGGVDRGGGRLCGGTVVGCGRQWGGRKQSAAAEVGEAGGTG